MNIINRSIRSIIIRQRPLLFLTYYCTILATHSFTVRSTAVPAVSVRSNLNCNYHPFQTIMADSTVDIQQQQSTPAATASTTPSTDNILLRSISRIHKVDYNSGGRKNAPMRNALILPPDRFTEFDPFLMMAEDWFKKNGGFPEHPHRGFETVTFALADSAPVHHKDSTGSEGYLQPGDIQWMTAGRGVVHSEMPTSETEITHTLQLWLNLPAKLKLTKPRYQDISADKIPIVTQTDGSIIKVISGTFNNIKGPAKNQHSTPIIVLQSEMPNKGSIVTIDYPANYNSFLYIQSGEGTFNKQQQRAGDVLIMNPINNTTTESISRLIIECNRGSLNWLFCAGLPLKEPVVQYGPFVMNTQAEIQQAFKDYQTGKFT